MEAIAFVVLLILIIVVVSVSMNRFDSEQKLLRKEGGILERYRQVLASIHLVAADAKVLRTTTKKAELVGTLLGHKTYVTLQHLYLLQPYVWLTIAVVMPDGRSRKRVRLYTEPVEPSRLWDEIQIETERLIDNV